MKPETETPLELAVRVTEQDYWDARERATEAWEKYKGLEAEADSLAMKLARLRIQLKEERKKK